MFPFPPPLLLIPIPDLLHPEPHHFISTLDRRTTRSSRYGKLTTLGHGQIHEDLLSFSLTSPLSPPNETLVLLHPVQARRFAGISKTKLKELFEELNDLQDAREGAPNQAVYEMQARGETIERLAEVLRGLGDDGVDEEEGKEKEKEKEQEE
jgi:hypothetical protein